MHWASSGSGSSWERRRTIPLMGPLAAWEHRNKRGARTHACRFHTRVNACIRDWRTIGAAMLLVTVEHKCFKMFAHEKTKWHCAVLRAVLALVPTPARNPRNVHTIVNAARRSACATHGKH